MSRIAAFAAAAFALTAAPAAADDYAATARNIIPSGQYGSVPPPAGRRRPGADVRRAHAAVRPGHRRRPDEQVQVRALRARRGRAGDARGASARRASPWSATGSTCRTSPATRATTSRGRWAGSWPRTAGCCSRRRATPRGWRRSTRRTSTRSGWSPACKQFTPTKAVDRMIQRDGDAALKAAGAAGAAVRHDIDVYLQGLNARLKADGGTRPWTRVDIYAANAITGQIFGEGGGDEARRSEFLSTLRKRYGEGQGPRALRRLHASSTTPTRRRRSAKAFPYGKAIGVGKGNAVLDAGSFKPVGPKGLGRAASAHPRWASNFLLVGASRSATGHPLFVGGPQIGYTYPGLTLEADISYPGVQARGATAPGLRGQHPDRPRPGLRLEPHVGGLGPDRHLRRDAVRRLEDQVPLQGQVPEDGHGRRGHDRGRGPREVQHHGPRPGHGLREGRRQDRRGLAQAGELRPGHPLAARRSGTLTTGKVNSAADAARRDGDLAVHVQRRLRGRPRHRDVLGRAGCPSATRGSTRACPPRAPANTSGRAS